MSLDALNITSTYHRDTYPAISPTKPSLSQAGRAILITGGGGGIGFEIARSFARAGASTIIIVGRRTAVLDAAAVKLREEFKDSTTEFIAHQGDIGDDASISSLWDFLNSRNIFVRVLVLNAAHFTPWGPDTLKMDKRELMEGFDVNVGGNFLMTVKFVNQPLRPAGQQLNLINVSTASIQMIPAPNQTPYSTTKSAFTALIGRIADEHPVEDIQIISYHPGALYSEGAARYVDKNLLKWDEMALPADYAVWAASPEASWLHGRFVWAHWDIDELKADKGFLKRLEEEKGFLRVAVQGLKEISLEAFLNK
ncbi:MAG: short-chain dehydrogenase/reductase [Lentinula lateritia]|uniref:Short-chain dehydrogenase/reductase n=1 Tax=Lentinula lateritia TaxID=40482 RepID=A0ABQ8VK00_9AGAR|nr:MAG: short-chain dehydrogenase/reductase [Lentinula lateritia]KAJ4496713.1 short-chain dehydrogenase/reductase [Lentinula lateritia]